MIKNLVIATSVASLVFISLPVLVLAQENENTTQPEQNSQSTSIEASEDIGVNNSGNIETRIKNLKDKTTEKISLVQSRRIEARCSNAQSKLTNLSTRLSESVERRRGIYTNSTTKLNELVKKLQAANVDTAELETAISEMTTIISSSLDSADSYAQNLADITELECTADPEGFKVVLQEARQKRSEIVSYQSEIQKIKNEKLKPALQAIKESLTVIESTNEESGE